MIMILKYFLIIGQYAVIILLTQKITIVTV